MVAVPEVGRWVCLEATKAVVAVEARAEAATVAVEWAAAMVVVARARVARARATEAVMGAAVMEPAPTEVAVWAEAATAVGGKVAAARAAEVKVAAARVVAAVLVEGARAVAAATSSALARDSAVARGSASSPHGTRRTRRTPVCRRQGHHRTGHLGRPLRRGSARGLAPAEIPAPARRLAPARVPLVQAPLPSPSLHFPRPRPHGTRRTLRTQACSSRLRCRRRPRGRTPRMVRARLPSPSLSRLLAGETPVRGAALAQWPGGPARCARLAGGGTCPRSGRCVLHSGRRRRPS